MTDSSPINIGAEEVQRLVNEGALLLEVLPRREYEEEHLAGAVHVPLKSIDRRSMDAFDRERAVIVYCWDNQCDLSPRAAWRLIGLGFRRVYDYVAGKADWLARGLPTEGRHAAAPRAGGLARTGVPTCALEERARDVRTRAAHAGAGLCIVVNERGVVLGRLQVDAIDLDVEASVEDLMDHGPSTFRPDVPLDEMAAYMDRRGLGHAIITGPDGVLLGVLFRDDLQPSAALSRSIAGGRGAIS